jgi:hypothetical protein
MLAGAPHRSGPCTCTFLFLNFQIADTTPYRGAPPSVVLGVAADTLAVGAHIAAALTTRHAAAPYTTPATTTRLAILAGGPHAAASQAGHAVAEAAGRLQLAIAALLVPVKGRGWQGEGRTGRRGRLVKGWGRISVWHCLKQRRPSGHQVLLCGTQSGTNQQSGLQVPNLCIAKRFRCVMFTKTR